MITSTDSFSGGPCTITPNPKNPGSKNAKRTPKKSKRQKQYVKPSSGRSHNKG